MPHAICYDQECVDLSRFPLETKIWRYDNKYYESTRPFPWFKLQTRFPFQLYNHVILVHSEHNSQSIAKTQGSGYIPVHWLCHALISRDWFRYAEYDPKLRIKNSNDSCVFLVYNRAWSGSREYRLKFAEMLVSYGLLDSCVTSLSFYDQNIHYTNHRWQNSDLRTNLAFEKFFRPNQTTSNHSADYTSTDYQSTSFEIVLETWFDSEKNHLTEKTFRPIAAGQPFILASTPHSLDYLRRYGFQTFAPWIDESYDSVKDPLARLQAITFEMRRLLALSAREFSTVMRGCREIADHNKDRFFSQDFHQQVTDELATGMRQAIAKARAGASTDNFMKWASNQQSIPDIRPILQELNLA